MEIISDLKNYPSWLQMLVVIWILLTSTIVLSWFVISPTKISPKINQYADQPVNGKYADPPANVNKQYRQTPSPNEIINSIEGQPLISKDAHLKNFIGLNVNWNLFITSLDPNDKDINVNVYMSPEDRGIYIKCTVNLEDYPELKLLKSKTKVDVLGTISEVESYRITLVDVNLNIKRGQ